MEVAITILAKDFSGEGKVWVTSGSTMGPYTVLGLESGSAALFPVLSLWSEHI